MLRFWYFFCKINRKIMSKFTVICILLTTYTIYSKFAGIKNYIKLSSIFMFCTIKNYLIVYSLVEE
jgi:hypothetical protein